MSLVLLNRIRQASTALAGRLHRTPVVTSTYLSHATGARVHLKLELFQKTGSFKPRGALTALDALPAHRRANGVITLSAGNHAQAVAWAAGALGIPVTVVMPATAVPSKVQATRGYGASVVQTDGDLLATTLELQRRRDLALIHPFDDPDVIAGQGTLALELLDDVGAPDIVLVPCGGGGLLAGVACVVRALRPATRVYGVEPTGAAGMRQSLDAGAPVRLERIATAADGLAAPFIGEHTFAHATALVDDILLVTDDEILHTMRTLMERVKVMAEPAGAAALAALLAGRVPATAGATIAVVVSGGNVDLGRLRDML